VITGDVIGPSSAVKTLSEETEMATLLDEHGLKMSAFDPVLRDILGNKAGEEGFKVIAEAGEREHTRIELRDWLYCLAKASGTSVRKALIDGPGQNPDAFVTGIEAGFETPEEVGIPPDELTPASVAPQVIDMLDKAETLVRDNSCPNVSGAELTLALLDCADDDLLRMLDDYHTAEGMEKFKKQLLAEIRTRGDGGPKGVPLFDGAGLLNERAFTTGGRRLCRRLQEDAASIGAKKVTTRHMLYTLLGNEAGPLSVALSASGIDVKKDLHAVLSRELVRPGKRRSDNFKLTRETVFKSVIIVLEESQRLAMERDRKEIAELDIHRAFAAKETRELTRLFSKDVAIDLSSVRDRMADSDDEEEPDTPLQRYTVLEIQNRINDTIFGQEEAVKRIVPWIKRLRFGIPRDARPAGVFLFLGPTGTGKTQLAKELARYVYGDDDQMIFLEMGQFQTKESMNMFVGAPPGYVGYGDGKLTNGLRDKPESVILFDEIEKAHTQVFDALLRFADEGIISDPAGPVRDGRKCIIVMTTNAGQNWLRGHLQNNPDALSDPESLTKELFGAAMKELQERGFRPEFLGRVDERITFLPFSQATCRQIVDGILKRELAKFAELKSVGIEVHDDVRALLAQFTFDRAIEEGARGAPRAVNQYIISPVIDLLSEYEEKDEGLPAELIATRVGMSDIELEVKE
jgi:ATP-dependent Clp protease ATP-binding subunit ClpA